MPLGSCCPAQAPPYPNQSYLCAMIRFLLALSWVAEARKSEPANARALLQAWQVLETHGPAKKRPIIQGFPASAFGPPPADSQEVKCKKARDIVRQLHVDAPVSDVAELRGKFHLDLERVEMQATMSNQSDGGSVAILEKMFEMRGKQLARFQQDSPRLNLFNPSVVPLPTSWRQQASERWLAAFRQQEFSSLHFDSCLPRCIASLIVIAVLDSELHLTRPLRVLTEHEVLDQDYECFAWNHICNLGPEDPRLLWHPSQQKMLLFFNSKIRTQSPLQACPKTRLRMHATELAAGLTVSRKYQIGLDSEVHGHAPRIGNSSLGFAEKNWSPFLYEGASGSFQILLEQSVDPHVVLEFDADSGVAASVVWNTSGSLVRELVLRRNFSHAHGSVGPVLISSLIEGLELAPPFYLSILHAVEVHDQGDLGIYHSYFFAFTSKPPFNILKVGHTEVPLTRQPTVYTSVVAFPVHLQVVTPAEAPQKSAIGNQLVIFYGMADCDARFLQLPLSALGLYL